MCLRTILHVRVAVESRSNLFSYLDVICFIFLQHIIKTSKSALTIFYDNGSDLLHTVICSDILSRRFAQVTGGLFTVASWPS